MDSQYLNESEPNYLKQLLDEVDHDTLRALLKGNYNKVVNGEEIDKTKGINLKPLKTTVGFEITKSKSAKSLSETSQSEDSTSENSQIGYSDAPDNVSIASYYYTDESSSSSTSIQKNPDSIELNYANNSPSLH